MQKELNKFQWVTAQLIRSSDETPLETPYKETYISEKKRKEENISIEFFSEDLIFDSYCRKCVQLIRDNTTDKPLVRHCIESSRKSNPRAGRSFFYYLDLLRIVSKEFDDDELQRDSTEIFIEYLTGFIKLIRRYPEVYSTDPKMNIQHLAEYGNKIYLENSGLYLNIISSVNFYLSIDGIIKAEGGIPEFIRVIKQLLHNSVSSKLKVPWSETYSPKKYHEALFQSDNQYEIFYKEKPDAVFDSYCQKLVQLIRNKNINEDIIRYCLDNYRRMSKTPDNSDYLLDLIRIVSKEFNNINIQKAATEVYLEFLLNDFDQLISYALNNNNVLLGARKTAAIGINIVEKTSGYEINPELIAKLYIAKGTTYNQFEAKFAIDCYLKALNYKEKITTNTLDEIIALVEKRIHEITAMNAIGVLGNEIINALELSYECAKFIERQDLIIDTGIELCNRYSIMRQPSRSENLAKELLENYKIPKNKRDHLRFVLASSLSEQFRGEEAIKIQKTLLKENSPILLDDEGKTRVTLYLNLGNSYRVAHRLEEALEAFTTAQNLNAKLKEDFTRNELKLRLHVLKAEILKSLNKKKEALIELKNLENTDNDLFGINRMHFNLSLAQIYYDLEQYDSALSNIENARLLLNNTLERGIRPDIWESILNSMHEIDGLSILLNMNVDVKKAFLISELSKGRILRLVVAATEKKGKEEMISKAISFDKIEHSYRNVVKWFDENPKSVLISFFAIDRGLILFTLSEKGKIQGKIIKERNYTDLLDTLYVPWVNMIKGWNLKELDEVRNINEITNEILRKTGEFIYEAYPRLKEGGKNLVIIPHRFFRSIPLIHIKLPNNLELSECFERVIISSTFDDFAASLNTIYKDSFKDEKPFALVDPNGEMPLTRFEGYFITEPSNIKRGSDFTAEEVKKAFINNKIVIVSSHGEFDNTRPWDSYIEISPNSKLELSELLTYSDNYSVSTDLVILGACEAARTQRTISDEPIGFPGILSSKGVKLILAPLWEVDSFPAILFISKFLDYLQKEEHPNSAVQKTAKWLKNLNTLEIKEILEKMIKEVKETIIKNKIEEGMSNLLIKPYYWLDYLRKLDPLKLPFNNVVDWAAFQLVGYLNIHN